MKGISNKLGRRSFLANTGAAATALTAGCSNDTSTPAASAKLHILAWRHFVPSYDAWWSNYTRQWGERNGVEVTIEHVELDEIPGRLQQAIEDREGPDLVEAHASAANLERELVDVTDIAMELDERFGPADGVATRQTYNPNTRVFHGICGSYHVFHGMYRRSFWETTGIPAGPMTWQELLDYGDMIRMNQGVPVGVGFGDDLDGNHAVRAMLYSFGGSIQDENENIVLNSPETEAALLYARELFQRGMGSNEALFEWGSRSNNQALERGEATYIVNSVAAYRTAQRFFPDAAEDMYLLPPLIGPGGAQWAGTAILNYLIPRYSPNVSLAKDYLLDFMLNTESAVFESELFNFPSYRGATPQLFGDGGWLAEDPFEAGEKLEVLRDSAVWGTNIGHPGPTNAAIGELFDNGVLTQMFRKVISNQRTPSEAIAEALEVVEPTFEKWRAEGLIAP